MANYSQLKQSVKNVIKQNGQQEITGDVLQSVLISMITNLGMGDLYAGLAIPSTNPGTPDSNVFYIAVQQGTYTNFGGLTVGANDGLTILAYNGTWTKTATGTAMKTDISNLSIDVTYNDVIGTAKNLFDVSKVTTGYLDGGTGNIITSISQFPSAKLSPRIKVYPGFFTLSNRLDTNTIVGYDGEGNKVKVISGSAEYRLPSNNGTFEITEESGIKSIQFTCCLNGGDISKIQLEAGGIATDFEPYKETTLQKDLNNIRASIDDLDYKIEDNNRNEILDGDDLSENMWYGGTTVGNTIVEYSNATVVNLHGLKTETRKGDKWVIRTKGGSGTGRAWAILDQNNKILAVADAGVNYLDEPLSIEVTQDNAYYITVNLADYTINKNKFSVSLYNLNAQIQELRQEINIIKSHNSVLYGKKYVAFGSSSTENWTEYYGAKGSYAQRVADRNDMNFTNLGKSGYTIANPDERENTILTQILSVEESVDYATIMAGANDIVTGGITYDGVETDPSVISDFYGAYKAGINHLLSINPGCRIGIIVPFSVPPTANFTKIRQAAHDLGEYYGIPVLDINSYGFDGIFANNTTHYTEEQMQARKSKMGESGGSQHLNDLGMELLANVVEAFMKGL